MLDPADPSGSARLPVAAACPHRKTTAASIRGDTQDLGKRSLYSLLSIYFLSFTLQSIPARFKYKRGQIPLFHL
jgi:hypothetical protein